MVPKQFIYISTLSVFGPVREKDYTPIEADDTPAPNTAYGFSKLKAELYIQSIPGFLMSFIVLREFTDLVKQIISLWRNLFRSMLISQWVSGVKTLLLFM